MPLVQARVRGRRGRRGRGVRVVAPPPRSPAALALYDGDRLFEEIAYIAYHFHWPLDQILDLEHPLRRRFVEEIASINRRRAEEE
ncbi:MAG TPA: DUF6760 family protein [Candidatus Dormibacteraeota bacterium]